MQREVFIQANFFIPFFHENLLRWFDANARDFPWRKESDPFKILIAEMMLQRTKANQVLTIYDDFIERFPNPDLLANSRVEDIDFFLARLGLHWRSRLMREMALKLITVYEEKVPNTREEIITLPGVGNYIADAVCVCAFNQRKTVIDSNVVRVVTRFTGFHE